jgi:hypothetical protein
MLKSYREKRLRVEERLIGRLTDTIDHIDQEVWPEDVAAFKQQLREAVARRENLTRKLGVKQ